MSTVGVPSPTPTASDDAESLRKALQGWRADKRALIGVLCRRTAAQRAAIRRAYAFLYREPLLNSFRQRLSRRHCSLSVDFWRAMIFWAMDPAERDANMVREALMKARRRRRHRRKDDDYDDDDEQLVMVLIEVSCASSPDHLMDVRKLYHGLFGCSLEEDVAAALPLLLLPELVDSSIVQMLVRLVSSYRYVGDHVDADVAKLEAAQLCEAIRGRGELNGNEVVARIISTRNKSQLRATLHHYREEHGGTDIVEDIIDDDSHYCSSRVRGGNYNNNNKLARTVLKTAVWCLTSPEKHFAEVIRHAVAGLGTYEDVLTRVIVSRAEVDMAAIKEEYRARYGSSVAGDVAGDTSFSYRDLLLALVGAAGD